MARTFIDTDEVCVNYLAGVSPGMVSVAMPILWQIPLTAPFILIQGCGGPNDRVSQKGLVDIHSFHATFDLASKTAREVDYLMSIWIPQVGVPMSTGDIVHADLVETIQGPHLSDYGDENLKRFTARYQITSRVTAQHL